MVIQGRIQKVDWLGAKSFAGFDRTFRVASARRREQQELRFPAKLDASWAAYALIAIGAGCLVAAFFQSTQVHPWMPLLLGWAGAIAILRGILCKGSHKA